MPLGQVTLSPKFVLGCLLAIVILLCLKRTYCLISELIGSLFDYYIVEGGTPPITPQTEEAAYISLKSAGTMQHSSELQIDESLKKPETVAETSGTSSKSTASKSSSPFSTNEIAQMALELEAARAGNDFAKRLNYSLRTERMEVAEKVEGASKEKEESKNPFVDPNWVELNEKRRNKLNAIYCGVTKKPFEAISAKVKARHEQPVNEVPVGGSEAIENEKTMWKQAIEREYISGEGAMSIIKSRWNEAIEKERDGGEKALKEAKSFWTRYVKNERTFGIGSIKEAKKAWNDLVKKERSVGSHAIAYENALWRDALESKRAAGRQALVAEAEKWKAAIQSEKTSGINSVDVARAVARYAFEQTGKAPSTTADIEVAEDTKALEPDTAKKSQSIQLERVLHEGFKVERDHWKALIDSERTTGQAALVAEKAHWKTRREEYQIKLIKDFSEVDSEWITRKDKHDKDLSIKTDQMKANGEAACQKLKEEGEKSLAETRMYWDSAIVQERKSGVDKMREETKKWRTAVVQEREKGCREVEAEKKKWECALCEQCLIGKFAVADDVEVDWEEVEGEGERSSDDEFEVEDVEESESEREDEEEEEEEEEENPRQPGWDNTYVVEGKW